MLYGATAAALSDSAPEQAESETRGQAGWVGGIAWLDDPDGALAVALCMASPGPSGPQVLEEWRWLSLAWGAAQQPGARWRAWWLIEGRRGYHEPRGSCSPARAMGGEKGVSSLRPAPARGVPAPQGGKRQVTY